MKQRKLERLILDLEDFMETIHDGDAVDKLKEAISELKEIYIHDYEE